MTEKKLSHAPVLLASPRVVFQILSKLNTKGYLKRKHHKLEPLGYKHDTLTTNNKKCKQSGKSGDCTNMPSIMDNMVIDQETLLEEYRHIIDSQQVLPGINVHPKRGKTDNKTKGAKKTPRHRKLREAEWKKGRPMFTEGLSSKSVQDEPVFYVRNQLFINSNQPGGIHCMRDKSKLILEATVDQKNQRRKGLDHSVKGRPTVSSLSMPKLTDTPTWGKMASGVEITRNNTILLPKVFVNQELPLIDSLNRSQSNRSVMYSPRDMVSTDLISLSEEISEPATGINTMAKLKNSGEPEEPKVPLNSPVKTSANFSFPHVQDPDNTDPISEGKTGVQGQHGYYDSRSQLSSQKGGRRYTEAPSVVSIGNSEDIEFTRRYRPTGKSSVVGMDFSDMETRPSTMESRKALSTPGRRLQTKKLPLDSMSLGVIESRTGTESKVVISEEENMIYNFVYNNDQKTEAKIPKIMFGDPVKESKKQDKKLNNSKLNDLYERGVIRSLKAGLPSPRIKTKDDLRKILSGNMSSRASCQSTVAIGNPPPSLATATSSPPYDLSKQTKTGMAVVEELDDSQQQDKTKDLEQKMGALAIADGEMSVKLEEVTDDIDRHDNE